MATWLYSGSGDRGIYASKFDPATGTIGNPALVCDLPDASFMAKHPALDVIYLATETGKGASHFNGAIALKMDRGTGALAEMNRQADSGRGNCFISVDPLGGNVLNADYGSGLFSVMRLEKDGSIGPVTSTSQDKGGSIDKSRQEGPHAHQICLDPAGKFAFGCDLGTDQVMIWKFDSAAGTLTPADPPSANVPPGSGPRHIAFHPSGKFAYIVTELKSTIVACQYYPEHGNLRQTQVVSALPADFAGKSFASEIAVHPGGKYLYASNRGLDSIAKFTIDEFTGKLSDLSQTPTQGKFPRHFILDDAGKYLIAGNQNSGNVVAFSIDETTGDLKPTGSSIKVPQVVSLLLVSAIG